MYFSFAPIFFAPDRNISQSLKTKTMATRKAKVLRAFLQDNPLKKTEIGSHVISETTDHPLVFTDPQPKLEDLKTANDDLRNKAQAALSGDTEAIKARDASEKEWIALFSKNCDYTDGVAKGNVLIIAQAGHKATKTDTTHKEKVGQAIIKVAKGDYTTKGKIDIECEALAGADFYLAVASLQPINLNIKNSQILYTPQSEVGFAISTTRKLSIEGLQSKQEYYVIVMGYNTAGIGPQSQAATVVAP